MASPRNKKPANPVPNVTAEGWTQKLPPLAGSKANWSEAGFSTARSTWRPKIGAGEGMPITSRSPPTLALDLFNAASIGFLEQKPGMAREQPVEIGLRAALWQAQRDMRKKVHKVVPHFPFAGQPMRFQDQVTALQILADGRFSFVVAEDDPEDDNAISSVGEAPLQRRMLSFEGVCVQPSAAMEAQLESSLPSGVLGAVAEGRALVRSEVEIRAGRPRLLEVERGTFSFELVLTPENSPTQAIVIPPRGPNAPFQSAPPWKRWLLPYQDKGPIDADAEWLSRQVEVQQKIERRRDRVSRETKITRLKRDADTRRLPPIVSAR